MYAHARATPQGFIKAAEANNATARKAEGRIEVAFTVGGKYKATGIVNSHNQVERVRTWVDQSLVGDMLVETDIAAIETSGVFSFPRTSCRSKTAFPRSI